ncbi:YicC/YloC family endoribonuclease [Zavarzinella formosa]|uniref:YicC/YloC family endoribonuclease n=1 Tax=Zavarzinella formosa TaxID=360055 RepID=UPI0002E4465F|nr:YicC/YloC family endoribonuclease [Zavarzinella formosa]
MLLSMTGFGEARHQSDHLNLGVEVRTVNNRYLKVSVRGSDPYPMLETELEKVVRRFIRRGTVTIHLRCDRQSSGTDFVINPIALRSYVEQIRVITQAANCPDLAPMLIGQVLSLPGVAPQPGGHTGRPPDEEVAAVEATLEKALAELQTMRQAEGKSMAEELLNLRGAIHQQLAGIRTRIPGVVAGHRSRLRERVGTVLSEHQISLRAEDLIREVAIFADRSDVSEELTRLESHLDQFDTIVNRENDSPGRKLEFLVQEMGREANTIGSKAGDVAISLHVVEIKAGLEKVRELVQNIE